MLHLKQTFNNVITDVSDCTVMLNKHIFPLVEERVCSLQKIQGNFSCLLPCTNTLNLEVSMSQLLS